MVGKNYEKKVQGYNLIKSNHRCNIQCIKHVKLKHIYVTEILRIQVKAVE